MDIEHPDHGEGPEAIDLNAAITRHVTAPNGRSW